MKKQLEFFRQQNIFKFKQSKKGDPSKTMTPPVAAKENDLQQKYEQLKIDNKEPIATKNKEKEKKVENIVVAKDMHSQKNIESTFVNSSRVVPDSSQKIPADWNDASYVKQISTYSKKFLKDINDPKLKGKAFLIGKPVYLENDMVFD